MFKPWRIGTVLGFPIEVNPTFLLLLGLVLVAFGGLVGVAVVLVAFASILLHELGHAVVARSLGVHTAAIELGFLGGAAKMVNLPTTARTELAIAAAGPAVSLMLGGAGIGLGIIGVPFAGLVGWINIVIAGFNLIPALPMDGGRILRAALSTRMDYVKATDIAVIVARVAAVGFAILGLMGTYTLLVLAPFLWIQGTREKQLARMMTGFGGGGGFGAPEPYTASTGRFGGAPPPRSFRLVQRGGRTIIVMD